MKHANAVLKELISMLILYLEELSDTHDAPQEQFAYGEKTAYVECLECLSAWKKAKKNGLNFNVEQRFPL